MKQQKIDRFFGKYRFLSNFYPCTIIDHDKEYKTLEHAYQSYKATTAEEEEQIRLANTPGDAKRIARSLPKRREGWDKAKLVIMESLLRLKFTQEPFKTWLLDTKDACLD